MSATISNLLAAVAPAQRDGFPVMKGYLPWLGHLPVLHLGAMEALRRAAREQGPLVQVSIGFGQWHLFCFGADTFELLRHKAVVVSGVRDHGEYLIGQSLMWLDGPAHRHLRSGMTPTFSARGLAASTAARVTLETVQRHARDFVGAGGGDAHAHLKNMALEVVFRTVGVDVQALSEWRVKYQRALWGLVPLPLEWPGTPRYIARRATAWINGELRRLIRRAAGEEGNSLLHALVRACDEDGQPLSEDELVANLRLLVLAGHETTATTLTFALAHLAERPDLVRRLSDEVRAAGAPPLSLADAKKLPQCESVFREAVRLYGPAWFLARKPTEDLELRGVRIPAGTRIALCPLLWGRDPETYPDPDRFEPDRWIGKPSAPTPYELSQFGGGPHFCLGYHMTWLESVQYLAVLLMTLSERKKTLRLATTRVPNVVYFPLMRPSPAAYVTIEGA